MRFTLHYIKKKTGQEPSYNTLHKRHTLCDLGIQSSRANLVNVCYAYKLGENLANPGSKEKE
jgi:hypothetical protein